MKCKLKMKILEKGYTSIEVAEKTGLSKQTISNWCNNKGTDSIINIYKVCKFLNIDIKDLF